MKRIRWQALFTIVCSAALLAAPTRAVIRTVGPTGSYATIQEAVDAAVAAGGYNDIRVAKGTYLENVVVPPAFASGTTDIRGGWELTFRVRSLDPAATVVDGGGSGRPFELEISGGRLQIEGFTITNGLATFDPGGSFPSDLPEGGGVRAELTRGAKLFLVNNHIRGNRALNAPPGSGYAYAHGGGVLANLQGASELTLRRNLITENLAASDNNESTGVGGGLWVRAVDGTRVLVQDNRIEENATRANNEQNTGSGVYIHLDNDASGVFHGNTVARNRAERAGTSGGNVGIGGALWLSHDSSGTLDVRRNRWLDNTGSGSSIDQVDLLSNANGTIFFTDSLVAGGDAAGVNALAFDESSLHLTNLTVTGNVTNGILAGGDPSATLTLFNSVLFRNGTDLFTGSGSPGVVANLIGIDPLFRDPAAGDYRLSSGSPAIDAGRNPLVPAERLGVHDLDGNARVANGVVDQGAYETGAGPGGGRERPCGVIAGPSTPIPRWAPVCLCFSDRSIREFRCRLSHPDLALELRVPLPLDLGEPFGLEWVVWPQGAMAGLRLEVELPAGMEALEQKPPHLLKLVSKPGELARAKLAVEVVEKLDAYPIGARLTTPAAGPDQLPIDLLLDLPLEAALEAAKEIRQEASGALP